MASGLGWRRFGAAVGAMVLGVMPAAAEICAEMGPTQFVSGMRYCVSSALAPQGGNDYGPDNLFDGNSRTAWCEGVPGAGKGQRVSIAFPGAPVFRRLYVENGYGKSSKAYSENARVRRVAVATSSGAEFVAVLDDRPGEQFVSLPGPSPINWISFTVLDVYPGDKYADTCMTMIMPDLEYEEFLLQQSQ